MNALDVYLHDARVGRLERLEQGRLGFTYDPAVSEAQRLSLSLPVERREFGDEECRPFFGGLLPEGQFLRAVARAFGVSSSNPFALLAAIGGECAGAVSLAPPDAEPPIARPPRWLNAGELHELIRSLPSRPLLSSDPEGGLRLSLAGAQDKLPVRFEGGAVGITRGAPPSTHIIKLPDPRFPDLVANEAFCTNIARELGLRVVSASPRIAEPVPTFTGDHPEGLEYLLIERYDRVGEVETKRIHQEDLCQALGVVPDQKYESEDGPGVAACGELLRRHCAAPAVDLLAFRDALLVNFLIGNHDAHAKNYSLLLEGEGSPRLAPLYDLVCTAAYPGLSRKLAMKLGGEYRPDYVYGRHLDRLARDLGMNATALRRHCGSLIERVDDALRAARETLGPPFSEREVVERIERIVKDRAALLERALAQD